MNQYKIIWRKVRKQGKNQSGKRGKKSIIFLPKHLIGEHVHVIIPIKGVNKNEKKREV